MTTRHLDRALTVTRYLNYVCITDDTILWEQEFRSAEDAQKFVQSITRKEARKLLDSENPDAYHPTVAR